MVGVTKNITEKTLAAALRKWGGVQTLAAKEIGTSRQNVYQRIKLSKKLQDVMREVEDDTLDLGEGHIIKGVRDGDKDYVKYYMDRKGKRRGYGPKVENSLDEAQLEGIVIALGGDPAKLRAALRQLGVDPDQA